MRKNSKRGSWVAEAENFKRSYFLTGGSGLLGRALIERTEAVTFICLVRRTHCSMGKSKVVIGDVTQARLGLEFDEYLKLAGSIKGIVHAAALTSFRAAPEKLYKVNVEGTRHVVELACIAGVPIYYISTAFVQKLWCGELVLDLNPYEASKREAERLITSSGLPYLIIRPSLILGDCAIPGDASGQAIELLLRRFLNGQLSTIPGDSKAYLDYLPLSFVTDTMINVIVRGHLGTLSLTAGTEAPRIGEVISCCRDLVYQTSGRRLPVPKFLGLNFSDLPDNKVDNGVRAPTNYLSLFSKYLSITQPLNSTLSSFGAGPFSKDHLLQWLERKIELSFGFRSGIRADGYQHTDSSATVLRYPEYTAE